MKAKVTILKTSLVALLVFVSSTAWSATFYTCIGTNLNLNAGTPAAGTTYLWDVRQGGTSISGYPSATAPTSFPTAGSYEVVLISQTTQETGLCSSDPVSNTIIVLPPLAIDLGTPSNPAYCEANGTASTSEIVATTTGFPTAYAADLGSSYTYSVVKDNGTPVDGATVGTVDATTGVYTLTTTTPGTYKITGRVRYTQLAGNTSNALLGTGCEVSSTEQTVIVTPKPAQPTITITAAN